MRDMGSMFTLYWTQAFFDGLQGHKETDIVMLPRAGWVGTWRHGAVLWSGDIGSTMEVLKSQVNIGISAQTSAIPWWTTDVSTATVCPSYMSRGRLTQQTVDVRSAATPAATRKTRATARLLRAGSSTASPAPCSVSTARATTPARGSTAPSPRRSSRISSASDTR